MLEFFSLIPAWGWVAMAMSCVIYAAFSIAEIIITRKKKKASLLAEKVGEESGGNVK